MANESALLEQVEAAFAPLVQQWAFRVVESNDSGAFGNVLVVLERQPIRVRVASDRGDVYIDVCSTSEPENWYPLASMLSALAHVTIAAGPCGVG